ncbi:MAG TPA: hypothetical protein DEG32_15550, partial [Balneolaceae bacterium]|nr:hypothetical protein [Balneolaceae bacterium]
REGEYFPIWSLDRQGRAIVSYQAWDPESIQGQYGSLLGPNSRNGRQSVAEYTAIFDGDSGTPMWVNVENKGFVFAGACRGIGTFKEKDKVFAESTFGTNIDLSGFELIDVSDTSEYQIIDYWELPDSQYRDELSGDTDDDPDTYIPTIAQQEIDVTASFFDDEGNAIDYQQSSQESIEVD